MTVVQRHAELIWAECTLLKVRLHVDSSCVGGLTDVARQAVLGIIYSGDFIAFLKEALNMRAATAVYKSEPLHRVSGRRDLTRDYSALAKYVEVADQEYGGEDPKLDQDFRSGDWKSVV